MWDYSEKLKDHFFNPRNVGVVENPSGVGEVGSLACGDALKLYLKVGADGRIEDAKFQTFGCGSAIASASALTEMVKGKTVAEVEKITNKDIAEYLGGLPPEKMHCSVMGREALEAAIADYRGEVWQDDHEEGALICKCFAVDEVMIEKAIRDNGLRSVAEITNYTKAGGGCSACHEGIEEILARVLGEAPVAEAAPLPEVASMPAPGGMTNLQRIRRIETVLESLRPMLQRDHGDVELVDVVDKTIYVNMLGACTGCQMAAMTLNGIQQQLCDALGELVRVVPASQMPKMVRG